MLGQNTFSWIDKQQATACYDQPFGAMSIILIGDFTHLPPVGDRLLFMKPSLRNHESSDHGYLLYKQFQIVVKLNQILRQDSSTIHFRELPSGICNGNISHDMWQTFISQSQPQKHQIAQIFRMQHIYSLTNRVWPNVITNIYKILATLLQRLNL